MTKLLVSVRTPEEALIAARGGADFIDLKEPRAGALGGLPVATIRDITAALRAPGSTLPISATIGDLAMAELPAILRQVDAVGDCGVDYVKVGIENDARAADVIETLARCGRPIVPVFIADRGIDFDMLGLALRHTAARGGSYAGVMADTADKLVGSLFDVLPAADIQRFVQRTRAAGVMVGLAGALRRQHLPALLQLAPDFAGFRSAVCAGDRASALDEGLLRALAAEVSEVVKGRTSSSPG